MDNIEKLNKLANGKKSNWAKETIALGIDKAAEKFVKKHNLSISDKISFIAGAQWMQNNAVKAMADTITYIESEIENERKISTKTISDVFFRLLNNS